MSEKLTKLMVTTVLNHGVKNSEVRDWQFKVREVDGVYLVDVSTSIAISPKKDLTKEEKRGKFQMIAFVISFLAMLVLGVIGGLLPDAYLGRELVIVSEIPGFVAQLIGARFLVRGHYKRHEEKLRMEELQRSRSPVIPETLKAPVPS